VALFAKQDIESGNLRVRAGQMLPSRFQNSTFIFNQLKKDLGKDAVVEIDNMTEGFAVIERKKLEAMQTELATLRKDNERMKNEIEKRGAKANKES